jgi:hypothetical protein
MASLTELPPNELVGLLLSVVAKQNMLEMKQNKGDDDLEKTIGTTSSE